MGLSSDFADSMTGPVVGPGEFEEAITIGHGVQCTPEQIGFSVQEPHGAARRLDTPVQAGQASSSSSATGDAQMQARPDEVPVAADEPPPEPSILAGPDEITIDGVRVSGSSSLVVLKAACASLGLPQHGNRSQIFTRMVKHLEQQALLAEHSVKHRLQQDLEREPRKPPAFQQALQIRRSENMP